MNNFLAFFWWISVNVIHLFNCAKVSKGKCSDAQGRGQGWIEHWLLRFQDVSYGFLLPLAFSKCTSLWISSNICSQVHEGKQGTLKSPLTISFLFTLEGVCGCGSLWVWQSVRMKGDGQAASVSLCLPSLPGTQDDLYKGGARCSLTSRFKMLILFHELLLVLLKFERKTNVAESPAECFSF